MYWYNGGLVQADTIQLSMDDPGLLYGATLFTTLRVYHCALSHPLTQWDAHCDRLYHSLQVLNWTVPNWALIQDGATTLAKHYPVLRITLFPDGREWMTGRSLPPDLAQRQQQGITAWIAEPAEHYERSLPHLKTGNYLTAWQARRDAQDHNAQEAILINSDGHWLETSTGTLWGWGNGAWWTPPLTDGLLPGVARSHLATQLQAQNAIIREETWTHDVIAQLEAIAYSNSVVGIIPIHTVLASGQRHHFDPQHAAICTLIAQFTPPSRPVF